MQYTSFGKAEKSSKAMPACPAQDKTRLNSRTDLIYLSAMEGAIAESPKDGLRLPNILPTKTTPAMVSPSVA